MSGIWILADTMRAFYSVLSIRVFVFTVAVGPRLSSAIVGVMSPEPPAAPFTAKNSFCVQMPKLLALILS